MSYSKSITELEHYASLIDPDECPVEGHWLDGQTPIEIAYKAAVSMQGGVYFPKSEERVYENIGKVTMEPVTTIASKIGRVVANVPEANGNRLEVEFRIGYWLLSLLFEDDRLVLRRGRFERDVYKLVAKDREYMDLLFYIVNVDPLDVPLRSRPSFKPIKPFKKLHHQTAGSMVRSINKKAIDHFTYENCPEVFDAINKQMATPYRIDMELLQIYREMQDDSLFTLEGKKLTEEQRTGILREFTSTLDVAEGTKGRKFWEHAFYDYRGRIYSSAVWLTHQGSKLSKSLFRLAKTAPIGSEGWFWMLVHATNCWGEDKLPVEGRNRYAEERLDEWMVWASNPTVEKGWKDADDPFCFLAIILELKRALDWEELHGSRYDYRSGIIVAWDATCSGLQVLSSLGRSEEEGKFCNITLDEEVGDYYKAIADEVWKKCKGTEAEKEELEKILARFRKYDELLEKVGDDKNKRKKVLTFRRDFSRKVGKRLYALAGVYWERFYDKRRKLSKRPCMTYFYSCREKTAAKQMKNDWSSEPGFEDLNSVFCYWLCKKIIEQCEAQMPVSTSLMNLMIDMGVADYKERKDFSIVAPRTKFLFMQDYKGHTIKRIKFNYKDKKIKLAVLVGKNTKIDYSKVKSATSPNFVHMLDGEIAKAIMLDTEYDVSCIHDSFGVIPANAGKLFEDIRVTFVSLFPRELLDDLMKQKNYEHEFKYGTLNVEWIIDNEYAFS